MMRAARIHRFGAPDAITLEDVERPAPAAGEVLVRVHAAGVGPWDAWIRRGQSVLPQPLPLSSAPSSRAPSRRCDGVKDHAVGDAVFGVTNACFTGAYAEHALVAADMIARRPQTLDAVAAASVPGATVARRSVVARAALP